jgi:hypothetical protein
VVAPEPVAVADAVGPGAIVVGAEALGPGVGDPDEHAVTTRATRSPAAAMVARRRGRPSGDVT